MKHTQRRRFLLKPQPKSVDYVELPDYFRIDFHTEEANHKLYVGYWPFDGGQLVDCILDGVDFKSSVGNPAVSITIPTAGDHIMYFKLDPLKGTSSSSMRFPYVYGSSTDVITGNVSYYRVPYPYAKSIGSNNGPKLNSGTPIVIDLIDFLPQTAPTILNGSFNYMYVTPKKIRIPVGCTTSYSGTSDWTKVSSIIEEYDFKYQIE